MYVCMYDNSKLVLQLNKSAIPQIFMEISCAFFHKRWFNGFESMVGYAHNKSLP